MPEDALILAASFLQTKYHVGEGLSTDERKGQFQMLWMKEERIKKALEKISVYKGEESNSVSPVAYYALRINSEDSVVQDNRWWINSYSMKEAYEQFAKFVENDMRRERDHHEYLLVGNHRALVSTVELTSFPGKLMIGVAVRNGKLDLKYTLSHRYLTRGRDYVHHLLLKSKETGRIIDRKLGPNYNDALKEFKNLTDGKDAKYAGVVWHARGNI